jgi:GNAT superfamily N-acetyltransferase
MKCEIRKMKKEELKKVLKLIRMHHNQDALNARRYYRRYFKRWGQGWDKVIVAVSRKRQLVGVSGYFYDKSGAPDVYWLGYTFIHPRFHGQGIGSQLLNYTIKDLRRRNARKLFVPTSSDRIYGGAVSFYTDHGFRWEGTLKDFYGSGEDQILMGRDLTPKPRRRVKIHRSRRRKQSRRRRRSGRRRRRR